MLDNYWFSCYCSYYYYLVGYVHRKCGTRSLLVDVHQKGMISKALVKWKDGKHWKARWPRSLANKIICCEISLLIRVKSFYSHEVDKNCNCQDSVQHVQGWEMASPEIIMNTFIVAQDGKELWMRLRWYFKYGITLREEPQMVAC